MKLFIIGNGFDCYLHGLPTKYSDFRKYILSRYPDAEDYSYIPESTQMPDGDEVYDEKEAAGYIVNITDSCGGEEWSCLESYLGNDIYNRFLYDLPKVNLEYDDNQIWHDIYINEDMSNHILNTFAGVKRLFEEWVREELACLDMSEIRDEKVAEILEESAQYLVFNYTDTLQKVYHIDKSRICFIHGNAADGSEIFFGHGDDEPISETFECMGTETAFDDLKRLLRKDTGKALENHMDFFRNLSDVDEIYSYGFSFSEVDRIYLEHICKYVDPANTVWYLGEYDWKEKPQYKELLEKYGFTVKLVHI